MTRARTASDEADVLISDLLMRIHNQELALRGLNFLAFDGRHAPGQRLDLEVGQLCGLFAVLEEHCAGTLKLADQLEAAISQMQREMERAD